MTEMTEMTEMNTTEHFNDHELPPLFDSTEKNNEEKSNDESYHLIISNKSLNAGELSDTSRNKILQKIIEEKRKYDKSPEPKNELSLISDTPLQLTRNLIGSWVNTGYLPYDTTTLGNSEIVDKSLLDKESSYKTCSKILSINKSNDKELCGDNSSNYSSVDTTAYILSNTKVKKKGETIANVINTKPTGKMLTKNTLHGNMSFRTNETQNIHVNSNVSTPNLRESNIKHVKSIISEEKDITNEDLRAISFENFNNSKSSRQKKLYNSRDSPTDIIVARYKENDGNSTKKNLHPAFRDSPPLEKTQLKHLMQRRRKYKLSINNFIKKSLDNAYDDKDDDDLEEETCTMNKSMTFIDLKSNVTSFQSLLPSDRLFMSCNALKEQIKRFSTLNYVSNNKCTRSNSGKKRNRKTRSATVDTNLYWKKVLQDKLNPIVILEPLPEEMIKYHTRKQPFETPIEELKEINEINDKNICNNNDPEICSNGSVTTVFNSEDAIINSVDSDVSTVLLSNRNNALNSNNCFESDRSTVILNTSGSLKDKDSEKNHQLNDDGTEQNKSDKDSDKCLGINIGLDKKLDENLNEDLDDKKLKYLRPVIVLERIKIQKGVKNSNDDIEKSEKSVKFTGKRKKHLSRRFPKYNYQTRNKRPKVRSFSNKLTGTDLIETLKPIVKLKKSKRLQNLKTNLTSSGEEWSSKLINLDNKLTMRPIVKLKRLSHIYYNVKSLNKSNKRKYKTSSIVGKVPVKEEKCGEKLKKKNILSLKSSSSETTEPVEHKVKGTKSKENKVKLPTFYTNDSPSDFSYNSDSESESKLGIDLRISPPLMGYLLNINSDGKQYREINKKIFSRTNTMVESCVVLPSCTDMNISNLKRTSSSKSLSILPYVNKLLNNSSVNNIQINISCPSNNKKCDTVLRSLSKINKNINERGGNNEKNHIQKYTFSTKAHDTNSDSNESE